MSGLRRKQRLLRKFHNRDYRHSYVESFVNSLVSTQIRTLRNRENLSQEELAAEVGTTQSGVSRYESPNYYRWGIETLRKLARSFDMALSIKFVSFGEALEDIEEFSRNKLIRPPFNKDPVFHGYPVLNFRGPKVSTGGGSATWTAIDDDGIEALNG